MAIGRSEDVRLTSAPIESSRLHRTDALSGDIVWTPFYAAPGDLPGGVVQRHVTAKNAVRHRVNHIANTARLAFLKGRPQQRIERGMAADQQSRGDKSKE